MYKVVKRDCPMFGIGPYVCEFICDTASDVSTLPTSTSEGTGGKTAYDNQMCASGSIAIVAENGSESKQYMLNNQDIWCPYSVAAGSSGGGSSGSSITVDFALSNTSENPVANKVIVAALDDKANVDDIPNIKVNEAVNADTVNGHSVNADVPENAKFTDTIPDLSPYALKSKYGDTTINVGRKDGTTVGRWSTAEGHYTTASGDYSHAEGASTTASDSCSHAEGYLCTASSDNSHAEGNNTTASGAHSHSEGDSTTASGIGSHAGGVSSIASSDYSFAHGMHVESNNSCEVSLGKFNKSSSDTLFSIGDGKGDNGKHNAFEITTTGGKLHDKDIATTDMSLPANGGNADTVDGKHASDFKAYQRYAPIYIGDLLDMTEMGTYSCCVPEVTNLPSDIAQWCYVTMIQFRDAGYRRYICVPLNNAVTNANELYLASEYVRDSEGKLIWRNVSDGGTAYTISEWGAGRVCSDVNNAESGFSAASGEAINAPNTFWSTILTAGQTELYRTQIAFPWGCDRNSQKIKYRSKDNGTWNEWEEICTSVNKPYVTGSATVAANSQICVTNHGFIPSAVIWWESAGLSGVAPSFNDSQFIINVISTDEITINYLMFK